MYFLKQKKLICSGAIVKFPIDEFEGGWGENIIKKLYSSDGVSQLHFLFLLCVVEKPRHCAGKNP